VKAFIYEGYYSPDDIASMLLWASGNYREAKKALTRASNDPHTKLPPIAFGGRPLPSGMALTNDEGVYLLAYAIQKKEQCSDFTALRKLLGGKYRVFWNRLKKRKPERGQTLQQVAQLLGAEPVP
jgi:hypothetical protein